MDRVDASAPLAGSTDAIFATDREGRVRTWNGAAERLLGWAAAEVCGEAVATLWPVDRHDEQARLYAAARDATPDAGPVRMLLRRKDGALVTADVALSPCGDGGVTAVARPARTADATTLDAPLFQAVLEAAPDGLVIADRDGVIVMVNSEAERLFGYERREILGRPVEMLVPEASRAKHPALRAGYLERPRMRPMGSGIALSAVRKDGSEFPVEISLSPIAIGRDVWIASTVRDVSARKRAEADLQRLKDDLTNMVVHDLKNPVTGILMMVQLALRKQDGLLDVHRRHFEQIARTSREMMRLILNLLDISKIEEGRMPLVRESVPLRDVVGAVAAEYGPIAVEMGKRLTIDVASDLPAALADATLLRRILTNLVVNGLRHSGGRDVRIGAGAGASPGTIVLSVTDHGRGIPVEDQGRIFEKFTSVRRALTADAVSDTGLGLPFCKLAAEQMGGRIDLTSTPEAGTVFAVTLPTANASV